MLSARPLLPQAGCDGADALTQTPELATWLSGLFPKQDLTVCCYIYQVGLGRTAAASDTAASSAFANLV